ncbi:DNA polymerase I [Thermaerobacter marianensis DSM 12885]|uniref:DNA polymerase I n=1 Tax=Thermaerobacter marianensis (strain ATCC 700841 / DSM 12885 / JCM 10246 / 7p75a) TaxID=644966 RepID=E6SGJ7_THEM7|nr:DNA polymerase I [Thermaerobacter marianensis]ADU50543.1 DNA polymerase I [Thermaerobacter marianensis DSM 12885]
MCPSSARPDTKLVLIDGHSLMYRAFFALPPLATADGVPTNAVYGFLTMLLRLLEEVAPQYIGVAFDRGLPAFRVERFPAYKGHRPEQPDELRPQFPLVKDVLAAMGVATVEHEGFEADDLLGTLAHRARAAGVDRVLLVTGDRDVLQLVGDGVEVLLTRKGISDLQRYDEARIREEMGIAPAQFLDVKALMGDPSDNIPGVPGIGEKTALKLIQQFGDLETVLARPEAAGGKKLPGLLRQYADQARLSRELARIRTDAPVEFDPERFARRPPDPAVLRPLLLRLEFRSLVDRLGLQAGRSTAGTRASGETGPGDGQDPNREGQAVERGERHRRPAAPAPPVPAPEAAEAAGAGAEPEWPPVDTLPDPAAVARWLEERVAGPQGGAVATREGPPADAVRGSRQGAGAGQPEAPPAEDGPAGEPVTVVAVLAPAPSGPPSRAEAGDDPPTSATSGAAGGGPQLGGIGLAAAGRAAAWVAAGATGGGGATPGPDQSAGADHRTLAAALLRRSLAGFDLKPLYRWLLRSQEAEAGRPRSPAESAGRGPGDAGAGGEAGAAPAAGGAALRPAPRATVLPAPASDLKLAAYLLDPVRNRYYLVDVARQFFGWELEEGPADRPDDPACRTTQLLGRDAALCARLRPAVEAELAARGLERVYREIELPLVPVLAAMEEAGIAVDRRQLEELGRLFTRRSQELAEQIYQLAGETFNINSTQQLGQILFERLGLPVVKKTKTGYSTDAEVLETLAARHPIAELVLEYRSLVKLQGTYVDGLAEHIGPDGRVHTTFQQTVAATGRLSSTQPNLQNIPIRDEPGRSLRRAFVAPPGHRLVAADYSQIELRVLAHYSGDEGLLEAFARGQDVHARTASEIFGVPLEQVTPEQRRVAKAVNFGLAYGQTDYGLARALRIDRADARRFMDRYFERYPGVKRYMEETIRRARQHGEVTTLLGRRRPVPEIRHRVYHIRQNAERVAINTPIQGTAADIMKLAMIRVYRALAGEGLRARIVLQVHDELLVEAPEDEVPAVAALLRREMEGAFPLAVPLVVDVKAGTNWYEMEAVGAGA